MKEKQLVTFTDRFRAISSFFREGITVNLIWRLILVLFGLAFCALLMGGLSFYDWATKETNTVADAKPLVPAITDDQLEQAEKDITGRADLFERTLAERVPAPSLSGGASTPAKNASPSSTTIPVVGGAPASAPAVLPTSQHVVSSATAHAKPSLPLPLVTAAPTPANASVTGSGQ